jgi:hypothetical protein
VDRSQTDRHTGQVAVLETARVAPRNLLARDHVVEIVKILALDPAEQGAPGHVLAGT